MIRKTVSILALMLLVSLSLFAKTELVFWHGIESPDSIAILEGKIKEFVGCVLIYLPASVLPEADDRK